MNYIIYKSKIFNNYLNKNIFILTYAYIFLYVGLIILNVIILSKVSPFLVMFNSIFLSLNSFFLGPIVLWRLTIIFYSVSLIDLIYLLTYLIKEDIYIFYNFGKFYFISDTIDIQFLFCCDFLGVICSMLVIFLGILTIQFSVEYMYREFNINYLLLFLTLFISAIVFLFYAFDLTLVIAAWETIGLLSYVLVNYYKGRVFTIKAAFKTFIYSRISDSSLFIFYILITYEFNTTNLSTLFVLIPFYMYHELVISNITIHFLSILGFCVFFAASIKAAQFWWHVWLPDAMDAPTPASALIHSSTLVIMGVYLLLRFSILLEFTFYINMFFAFYGSLTIALGAISAICQTDLKKLIAYSTISQIGYLFLGCGFCCFNEVLLYLIVHALNKATLFIIAGYIIHFFKGNTDMRLMGGLSNVVFDFCVGVFIIWINLSGFPGTFGFFSKEFLLLQCMHNDLISIICFVGFTISFFCTPVYTLIILSKICFGYNKSNNNNFFSTYQLQKQTLFKYHNLMKSNLMSKNFYTLNMSYLQIIISISGFVSTIFIYLILLNILFIDNIIILNVYSITSINKIFFYGDYLLMINNYNNVQLLNLNSLMFITLNKLVSTIFLSFLVISFLLGRRICFNKNICLGTIIICVLIGVLM